MILYSLSSLRGMCWRGIAPSHTIVTRDTYFSCANLPFPHAGVGKWKGWQGTLVLLSLAAPAKPVYEIFVGVCM